MSISEETSVSAGFAWPAALASAAVAGTLATSCMMPFVALAVASAATISRPRAAATLAAAWGTNQLLGFTLLGYPPTALTFAWGGALGVASLIALFVAAAVLGRGPSAAVKLIPAFAVAFLAYEGSLFAFGVATGGTAAFTAKIIAQILVNDACWLAALVALHAALTRAAPRTFGPALSLRLA